jgi:hypothetical protein
MVIAALALSVGAAAAAPGGGIEAVARARIMSSVMLRIDQVARGSFPRLEATQQKRACVERRNCMTIVFDLP